MSGLTLYLDLISQPCRALYIFAKANGIPFNNHVLLLFKGEHLTEEFGKVNLLRKLPTMKDGEFSIGESTAIFRYLVNKYKTPDHWYPSDIQKRALVDEYLAWQHANTRPHGSLLYVATVMAPYAYGHALAPEKLKPLVDDYNSTLTYLEDKFLKGKPFIAGDKISIADLLAIEELLQTVPGGIVFYENRPVLAAWKQRVEKAIGAPLWKEAHEKLLHDSGVENLSPEWKVRIKLILQNVAK
ncbi:glutathione S-transferase theta-3-like [Gastrophryne carolinensis]